MKLNIDFYSKNEVSVTQTLNGSYQYLNEELRSILLFGTYLTRLYSIFRNHPIAKVLSSILRRFDQNDYQNLMGGRFTLPKTDKLAEWLNQDNLDPEVDLDVLERMIFQPMPKLVPLRSPTGKYGFHLSLSPCKLDLKGFNMFSPDLNHYLFQSVFPAILNVGNFFQSTGITPENLGFTANFISIYYQKVGPKELFNSEEFALSMIIDNMTHRID